MARLNIGRKRQVVVKKIDNEDKAEKEIVELVNKVESRLDKYIEKYGNTFTSDNVEKYLALDVGLRLFYKYGVEVKFNKETKKWEVSADN